MAHFITKEQSRLMKSHKTILEKYQKRGWDAEGTDWADGRPAEQLFNNQNNEFMIVCGDRVVYDEAPSLTRSEKEEIATAYKNIHAILGE